MPRGGKGGRKKRARTVSEKLLMAEFSLKLYGVLEKKGWDKQKGARELAVSRASFYNYLNQTDLASFEVLKRAHDRLGMKFDYIDFGASARSLNVAAIEQPRQYVLPFLKSVRENDIEVISTKPVRPDTLQLTINVKFAG
jgi:hypothetical protein